MTFADNNSQRTDAQSGSDVLHSMLTSSGSSTATGTAMLTSVVLSPPHWFAFGTTEIAVTTHDGAFSYSAFTRFDRRFELSDPFAFTFGAEFNATTQPGGSSTWQAQLVRLDGDVLQTVFADQGTSFALPGFRGTLTPGQYALLVAAGSRGEIQGAGTQSAHAGFDFNFDLAAQAAPTPEPASILLLGTGLVAVVARRRRQQR